ncbi:hypothetical protein ACFRCQ_22480 [Cytobacillus firmus]|uniref:hypothetical protein n=1 Tax=Bacillaceae TaxID=186817 RepID=UPI001A8C11C0|nr:hypothetical protein [Bacillus sp. NTK034]MBN8203911.1 hypothetical protein [Bacillus sp. NTK034]
MNLDKYPKTKELIIDVNLEDQVDRIKWLQLSKEEAAVSLAKTYLVALLSINSNPFSQKKASSLADQLYFSVGYKLHGFAKAQGNDELNYDSDDVAKLYKHISFSGVKYRQQQLKS